MAAYITYLAINHAEPLGISTIISPGLVWKACISKLSVCLSCILHRAQPPEDSTLSPPRLPFSPAEPGARHVRGAQSLGPVARRRSQGLGA